MAQTDTLPAALYSSFGDDPDLGELVTMFVDEMPQRVATLLEQCQAADWEALSRTAHQLKGAAGSYGFDQLTPFAARLEASAKASVDVVAIHQAVDDLVELCGRAHAGVAS